ncbi:sporulation histidine kinase inhibitor Sda [Aquibacillus sp. 3ASR75-11]|uniref:Sporulation histidine kinase inhibitor Sda n=1 Tax=Terrihalobacillus insolitus TaxID=2950438 RepID=A0A9X4AP67_9BACI|nr:sporulation histidine kinase inhibitor Sda [Terrihalobacillus insolitus]MDC3413480.1 sporulation histidine kinase inhibitor Sda [Terrihalobacillus insolitus]MDC3425230.1 sporulation histidine kinase inhibitor Sda [Terrihalobacillus insolitus]
MFENLSDQKLIEGYKKAKELGLDREFVRILESALLSRGLKITN